MSCVGCVDTAFPTRHWRRAYSEALAARCRDARGAVPMIVAVPDDRRCIVVGAGLLGLSAAWALSRRRWRVTLSWRPPARSVTSVPGSKGDARIFRLGYPEPLYVEMAVRSRELWRRPRGVGRTHAPPRHRPGDASATRPPSMPSPVPWRPRARRPSGWLPARPPRRFPGIAAPRVRALRTRIGRPGGRRLPARPARDRATSRLRTGMRVTSLRQRPDSVTVGDGGRARLRGRRRRRLRRSRTPSGCSAAIGPWRRPPVAAPGGLLRARGRRRRRAPARLHRVGGRHDLRPAGARRRAARRHLQGVPPHARRGPRPVRPHRPGALRRRPGTSSPA